VIPGAVTEWSAAPVFSVQREAASLALQVTIVGGSPAAAEGAADGLSRLLQRWDVTRPGSELDRLRRSTRPTRVDDDTLLLLALASDAAVHLEAGTARLSPHGQLPGLPRIVALALDIAAEDLRYEPVAGFRVAVGGDVIARGTAPTGHGWPVAVGDGDSSDDVMFVRDGSVVTVRASSSLASVQSVTVHAATAWTAVTLGLAALATPAAEAARLLEQSDAHAWLCGRGWVREVISTVVPEDLFRS
jgi:thiamine biosynthesis lipoprotein ApbE